MTRVANTLAEAWKEGRGPRAHRGAQGADDGGLDIELEHLFVEQVSRFALALDTDTALRVCQAVLELTGDRPRKVADFLNWITLNQDNRQPTTTFWVLWQRIADDFCAQHPPAPDEAISTAEGEDEEDSDTENLLRQLFLNLSWGKETRDRQPLHGEAHRIRGLFARLPASQAATRCYTRFLATVGSPTLPDALCSLSVKLEHSELQKIFSPDAIWYLETILGRLISGGNRRVRSEAPLREHVLRLLDGLAAAGSSIAYKLRDDFITPSNAGTVL